MATIYVRKTGDNANDGSTEGLAKLTINGACVTAASNNGDTINIGPGTYNETVKIQSGLGVSYPLHLVGSTGDPDDVIISEEDSGGQHGTVSLSHGGSISHITVHNTSTSTAHSATAAMTQGGLGAGIDATNCVFKSNAVAIRTWKNDIVLDRCKLICTHKGTTHNTTGVQCESGVTTGITAYSCLFQDWNYNAINNSTNEGTVINCTVQTDHVKYVNMRGIWALNSYNSLFHNNSGVNILAGIQATTIKNCISYGVDGDDDYVGTETACKGFSDVAADGDPVFNNEGSDDFTITSTSLAHQNGTYEWQTANSVALTDLLGVAFDDTNPSIGCYQFASGGGAGYTHNIVGTAAGSIASVIGTAKASVSKCSGI